MNTLPLRAALTAAAQSSDVRYLLRPQSFHGRPFTGRDLMDWKGAIPHGRRESLKFASAVFHQACEEAVEDGLRIMVTFHDCGERAVPTVHHPVLLVLWANEHRVADSVYALARALMSDKNLSDYELHRARVAVPYLTRLPAEMHESSDPLDPTQIVTGLALSAYGVTARH